MNVNPTSADFGNVVPWDSLTDEQKQSGEWIELPDVSGGPRRARQKSPIESLFSAARTGRIEEIENFMRGRVAENKRLARQFDANGKVR